ncbi:MAG: hypothetical protein FWB86_12480 [Treponema sp.]|nr:hypothetical protein [Treponema sp.]MCL2250332.1 hypothetical protein [Treponema sp.]
MFKKIIIFTLFTVILSSGVFAKEKEQKIDERTAKNRISLSVGLVGADLSYERVFNHHFSLLGQVSYNNWVFADSIALSGKARVYPFGKTFYLELGLGYSNGYSFGDYLGKFFADLVLGIITFGFWYTTDEYKDNIKDFDPSKRDNGFSIQAGMGWNIDIGKPDGFILPIGMGIEARLIPADIIPPILPYLRIGLGYSF